MDNNATKNYYKRPRNDSYSNGDHAAVVTLPNSNNDTTTTVHPLMANDNHNDQHNRTTLYDECSNKKRVRYDNTTTSSTTVDTFANFETNTCHRNASNSERIQQQCPPSQSSNTIITDTATITTTMKSVSSSSSPSAQSIPWWIQQHPQPPQQNRNIVSSRSPSTCRICQRLYVSSEPKSSETDATTDHAKVSIYSKTNNNTRTKTLYSYFPLRSSMVHDNEDGDKKPRSRLTNGKLQAPESQSDHNIITTTTSTTTTTTSQPCQYCGHDDFCYNCSVELCITCHYLFCYFCRTLQENGDIQCIDCYSNHHHHRNKQNTYGNIETTFQKTNKSNSIDEMDVD